MISHFGTLLTFQLAAPRRFDSAEQVPELNEQTSYPHPPATAEQFRDSLEAKGCEIGDNH